MSTKVSLDHGEAHHLYADIFRPNTVYLELHGVEFEASPNAVTVGIPGDLWGDDEGDSPHPLPEPTSP